MQGYFGNTGIHFFEPEGIPFQADEMIKAGLWNPDDNGINYGQSLLTLAREFFENEWIPISLDGSRNLFRMYIRKDTSVLFALDTTIREDDVHDSFHGDDIAQSFSFDIKNLDSYPELMLTPNTKDWLEHMARRKMKKSQKRVKYKDDGIAFKKAYSASVAENPEIEEIINAGDPVSAYLTLIKYYFKEPAIRSINIDLYSDTRDAAKPFDVDLFLDLGNSRSIGLLVEDRNEPHTKITIDSNAKALKILPLDKVLSEPGLMNHYDKEDYLISSNIQFKRSTFSKYPPTDNFFMPNIVSIGDRKPHKVSTENPYSVSAPKRYLWDRSNGNLYWTFEDGRNINGDILQYLDLEDRDEYYDGEMPLQTRQPLQPQYPKRTMVIFALFEIIYQAYCFMNSAYYRKQSGHSTVPRKLKNVVVSFPTAMPYWERERFKRQADKTLKILKRTGVLKGNDDFEIHLGSDEASSSQLSFLYAEAIRFKTDINKLLDLINTNQGEKLRIATLDIGGGTTDLSICEYGRKDPNNPNNQNMIQRVIYSDGIYSAGDDVVKEIVQNLIIPNLRKAILDSKDGAVDRFVQYFGLATSNAETNERTDLINNFFYPMALLYMLFMQKEDLHREACKTCRGDNAKLSNLSIFLTTHVKDDFAKKLSNCIDNDMFHADSFLVRNDIMPAGGKGLVISNLIPERQELEATVKSVLGDVLRRYSVIINQYNPSFLLFAGKTTSLPAVTEMMKNLLSISPDRIVPLTDYYIGEWYPFCDERGFINDPKTGVVVGGAIGFCSAKGILDVNIETSGEDADFTLNYIGATVDGQINSNKIENSAITYNRFNSNQQSLPIHYSGIMNVMYRNIDDENMTCSMLYKIKIKNSYIAGDSPIRIFLNYENPNKHLFIEGIEGSVKNENGENFTLNKENFEEYITLEENTMFGDEYYLDSGRFDIS